MLGDNIRTLRKSKGFTQEMFRAESHCRVQKASWQVPHMERSRREQMKEQLFEGLAQICPKGMCFPVIEYECTENVGLRFLDREYLDTVEKPSKGSATSILMMMKPDVETGSHGLKMRACVIQTPVEPGTKRVEAELFSYTMGIEQRTEKLD